jgi:hypothetical protein
MPVIKLFKKGENRLRDAVPLAESTDILCQILTKRISSQLLETQTAEQIVIMSGGLLRELIRIANECCRICWRLVRRQPHQTDLKINDEILDQAVNNIRNDFAMNLGKVDYEILQEVYQQFASNDPRQPEFLDLLHGLSVLEYSASNERIWYDVHPIVVELLKEQGLI